MSYMAPEVFSDDRKKRHNKAVDLWGLGLVIQFITTGERRFETALEIGKFEDGQAWNNVSENVFDRNEDVRKLVEELVVRDPKKRSANYKKILDMLDEKELMALYMEKRRIEKEIQKKEQKVAEKKMQEEGSVREKRKLEKERQETEQKMLAENMLRKLEKERQEKEQKMLVEEEKRRQLKEKKLQEERKQEKATQEKKKLLEEERKKYQVDENEFVAICKKGDPLRKAVVARKLRVVEVLMDTEGLLINLRDKNGRTILHSATGTNEKAIVRKILSHPDIEVNPTSNKGLTPVMEATKNGKIESLQILLEDGRVDLDVEDEDEKTIENMLAKDLAPHEIVRAKELFKEARTRKGIQDGSIVRKKTAILVANCNYEKTTSLKGPKMDLEIGIRLFGAKGYKVYPIENSKDIAKDVFELIEKENLRESTEILQFVYSGHGFHQYRVEKSSFLEVEKELKDKTTTEKHFEQEGDGEDCLVNTDGTLCEELFLSWQIAAEMMEDTTICLFYNMCRNESRKDVNEKTVKEFVKTNSFGCLKGAQESGADRRTIKIFSAQLGVRSEGLNSFFKRVCEQIEESSPDGMRFEDMETYESKDQPCLIVLGGPGLANKVWPLE
eukprot:GFUD01093827.1.p1 GENE.GFUD01093827.1~~GFUD01093827.1.p1  ORF type:complete len:670 (+),score=186.86 GFUD01093827.1:170-2011(+)